MILDRVWLACEHVLIITSRGSASKKCKLASYICDLTVEQFQCLLGPLNIIALVDMSQLLATTNLHVMSQVSYQC